MGAKQASIRLGRPASRGVARRLAGTLAISVSAGLAAAGCATGDAVLESVNGARVWAGQKFVDVVDATDKAFGESRIEDRQEIARAKVGVRAEVREHEETARSVPSNFRVPLPGIKRRFNLFLDLTAATDAANLSDLDAAAEERDLSLRATILKAITETLDLGATVGVHGGPDVGPEVFARYERKRSPWALFGEQRGYWLTDDGWGGRTTLNVDYRLAGANSFVRFANKADYHEHLHGVDLKSGLIYRWLSRPDAALSLETGVEYNPYDGNAGSAAPTTGDDDGDQTYARVRIVGKLWRDWIEWEVMPGYYYLWEHDAPGNWGIDVRLSLTYESVLGAAGD